MSVRQLYHQELIRHLEINPPTNDEMKHMAEQYIENIKTTYSISLNKIPTISQPGTLSYEIYISSILFLNSKDCHFFQFDEYNGTKIVRFSICFRNRKDAETFTIQFLNNNKYQTVWISSTVISNYWISQWRHTIYIFIDNLALFVIEERSNREIILK